jgi:hypothetical protein
MCAIEPSYFLMSDSDIIEMGLGLAAFVFGAGVDPDDPSP